MKTADGCHTVIPDHPDLLELGTEFRRCLRFAARSMDELSPDPKSSAGILPIAFQPKNLISARHFVHAALYWGKASASLISAR